jgi:hypothetical protein
VLDLAGQFDVAVDNAIIQTGWLLRDVLKHADSTPTFSGNGTAPWRSTPRRVGSLGSCTRR